KMNAPIPLGGIAIKRDTDPKIKTKIDDLIRQSVEYAFKKYPFISQFVKDHAQAMHEDIMRQHIDLYVNDYSIALGDKGKSAIRDLYKVFLNGNKNEPDKNLFLKD